MQNKCKRETPAQEVSTPKKVTLMAKNKNTKADKPEFGGCITFDGNIQVRIPNHGIKTLRTDLGGMKLQSADPNKELIVLMKQHVGYDEIDTGYIVRTKQYDVGNPPYFGLKATPDADSWGCFNYCDVIAWGYADGGLNDPTLFYSCQSTVAEETDRERRRAEKGLRTHAERMAELAEREERDEPFVMKYRRNGDQIETEISAAKKQELIDRMEKNLQPTLQEFLVFTQNHPDIVEMHFYTDTTLWDQDMEDSNCG